MSEKSEFEGLSECDKKYEVIDLLEEIEGPTSKHNEALETACEFLRRWWEC